MAERPTTTTKETTMRDLYTVHHASTFVTNLSPDAIAKAARYVASQARDTEDARLLLTALGIVADPASKTTEATLFGASLAGFSR